MVEKVEKFPKEAVVDWEVTEEKVLSQNLNKILNIDYMRENILDVGSQKRAEVVSITRCETKLKT